MNADAGKPTNPLLGVHGEQRPEGHPAVGIAQERRISAAGSVAQREVQMPVHLSEWWGTALSVLLAAVHHPHVYSDQQPEAGSVAVALGVRRGLPELQHAADIAAAQGCTSQDHTATVRRHKGNIVISPGVEVSNPALELEIFAGVVPCPASEEARIADGTLGYSASAWSRDISRASGALDKPLQRSLSGGNGVEP